LCLSGLLLALPAIFKNHLRNVCLSGAFLQPDGPAIAAHFVTPAGISAFNPLRQFCQLLYFRWSVLDYSVWQLDPLASAASFPQPGIKARPMQK